MATRDRFLPDRRPPRTGADLVEQVRALLLAGPGAGVPTLSQVAEQLATGPRNLRRQLQRAGTSYPALVDEVRHELVLRHLAERPQATGPELAARLGYAEPPAFYRAFRRWTGLTVTDYRDRLLSPGRRPRNARRDPSVTLGDDLSGVSPSG